MELFEARNQQVSSIRGRLEAMEGMYHRMNESWAFGGPQSDKLLAWFADVEAALKWRIGPDDYKYV
jgi:hypothetical protein